MTTSIEKKDEILAKMFLTSHELSSKPMMGEFLLYVDGVHIGGIYDGKVLLKETKENEIFNLTQVKPYESAKRTMFYLKDLDDHEKVQEIILKTFQSAPRKKK